MRAKAAGTFAVVIGAGVATLPVVPARPIWGARLTGGPGDLRCSCDGSSSSAPVRPSMGVLVGNAALTPTKYISDRTLFTSCSPVDSRSGEQCSTLSVISLGYSWGKHIPKEKSCGNAFSCWMRTVTTPNKRIQRTLFGAGLPLTGLGLSL